MCTPHPQAPREQLRQDEPRKQDDAGCAEETRELQALIPGLRGTHQGPRLVHRPYQHTTCPVARVRNRCRRYGVCWDSGTAARGRRASLAPPQAGPASVVCSTAPHCPSSDPALTPERHGHTRGAHGQPRGVWSHGPTGTLFMPICGHSDLGRFHIKIWTPDLPRKMGQSSLVASKGHGIQHSPPPFPLPGPSSPCPCRAENRGPPASTYLHRWGGDWNRGPKVHNLEKSGFWFSLHDAELRAASPAGFWDLSGATEHTSSSPRCRRPAPRKHWSADGPGRSPEQTGSEAWPCEPTAGPAGGSRVPGFDLGRCFPAE